MKKVLVVCLALVMTLSMSLSVLAAPGAFVSSPSGNPAPTLVEGKNTDEDCVAMLKIVPYAERDQLPDMLKTALERAYDDIRNSTNLTDLCVALFRLAATLGIAGENLAVSDMFDISYYNCDDHEDHGDFDITLSADSLHNFVGLLHLKNGEWELVENAKVVNNNHLVFSVDSLSPFAVVVDTTGLSIDPPQTGDFGSIALYAVIMLVSAIALVVVVLKLKKKESK